MLVKGEASVFLLQWKTAMENFAITSQKIYPEMTEMSVNET